MDLHPGLDVALAKFDWNETDVAKALAAGELTSPQKFMNSWFFRVRVSGTGFSFRPKLDEYVYRPVDVYISPEFLERVRGLPVVWEHPERMTLDTDELHRRIVGTIVLPYVGDAEGENPDSKEVWGVARIIDAEAAREMRDKQLSTSPAVDFGDRTDEQEREPMEDGRHLLIEGDPQLIDHLAICTAGVWDRVGPPSGVDRGKPPPGMDSTQRADDAGRAGKQERAMADTEEKREEMEKKEEDKRDDDRKDDMRRDAKRDDRRRDAKRDDDDDRKRDDEGSEHAEPDDELKDMVKRIADSVDRLAKRQDSIEKRMDRKRDDDDDRRDDRKRRRDAKRDDDDRRRDDEDEDTERRQAAELEELAAEERSEAERKAEDDKRDDDNEACMDDDDKRDDRKRRDARKRDDDRAHRDDRKRDDRKRGDEDEDAEEEAEGARGDSAYVRGLESKLAGVQDQLRDLQRRVGPRATADERELAEIQSRADAAYSAFGERAQPPMLGETATAYQIRMARGLQAHSQTWKDEDLGVLARHSATAFATAIKGIYADAAVASTKRADEASGVLIPIPETSSTGHRIVRYQGDPSVWMAQFGANYGVGRLRDPRRSRNFG